MAIAQTLTPSLPTGDVLAASGLAPDLPGGFAALLARLDLVSKPVATAIVGTATIAAPTSPETPGEDLLASLSVQPEFVTAKATEAGSPPPFTTVPNLVLPRFPGVAPTASAPEEGDEDDGPVPKGLEKVADALAAALAAVMAAAGKAVEVKSGSTARPAHSNSESASPVAAAALAATPAPSPSIGTQEMPAEAKVAAATMAIALKAPPADQPQAATTSAPKDRTAPAPDPTSPATAAPLTARISPPAKSQPKPAEVKPVGKTTEIPEAASADQTRPAIEHPAELASAPAPQERTASAPLLTSPTPAPVTAIAPAAPALVAPSVQPLAPTEIIIHHHLDLAKDGEWLDRLARDIARLASNDSQLRFQLNPENLGSLHVEIANRAEGTAIRLTADSEAARTILTDAQPRLVAEARAQGLRISEAHVDLGSQSGQQQRQQPSSSVAFIRTQQGNEEPATEKSRASAERYA